MGRKTAIIIIILLALQTFFILTIGIIITKMEDTINPEIKGIKGLVPKYSIELECEPDDPEIYGDTLKCKGRID